ncbi:hypothetical protein ESA_02846 [Cronobacter sakazakii ATCC BAA-894]|uniref:Uncharacterized protein n=1 Tax=Cronobacter sakazakii (strain ATCC BAA-894) TaxID=290339 RepID=A7MFK7_CROS8|nr:hypothetical protein ESA_02846 [Cronobacter sakazakii ATCC BAA-894]
MLAAELAVKIAPQFNGQLIGRAEKQHAPDVAQQINHYRNHHQQAHPQQHLARGVMVLSDAIDNVAHHFWRHQLQNGDNNKQGNRAEVATPLPAKIPA